MNLPKTQQTPDDLDNLPPARRRRAGRKLTPITALKRQSFLDELALRVSPSFDLFLFSLVAAITICFGFSLDSPALLVLGALFAPTMTPLVGLSLGIVTGSIRFFFRSLISILIICVLVLGISVLTGYLLANMGANQLVQLYYHSRLSWHNLVVLAIGAILTTRSLIRSKRKAAIASVALSYEIFLPLAVAGFGIKSGLPHLWPDGLVVFSIHLALAAIIGTITLVLHGFRPLTLFGYTLGGVIALGMVILLIGLSGAGAAYWGQVAIPTAVPTTTPTHTVTPTATASTTLTTTPLPPTETLPPSNTPSPTPSPSDTPAPSPTPFYALVSVPEELGGAILRAAPGFNEEILTSALNGTLIEILSDAPVEVNGVLWLQVRLPNSLEGWMLQSALLAATPAPNW